MRPLRVVLAVAAVLLASCGGPAPDALVADGGGLAGGEYLSTGAVQSFAVPLELRSGEPSVRVTGVGVEGVGDAVLVEARVVGYEEFGSGILTMANTLSVVRPELPVRGADGFVLRPGEDDWQLLLSYRLPGPRAYAFTAVVVDYVQQGRRLRQRLPHRYHFVVRDCPREDHPTDFLCAGFDDTPAPFPPGPTLDEVRALPPLEDPWGVVPPPALGLAALVLLGSAAHLLLPVVRGRGAADADLPAWADDVGPDDLAG